MHMEIQTEALHTHDGQSLELIGVCDLESEVKSKLAHTVRSNARRHKALTPSSLVKLLARDLPLSTELSLVAKMSKESSFGDIKAIITPSGQVFLYSLNHMDPREADAKGRIEEVKHLIAEKIRRDSRVTTALTPLGALYTIWPDFKSVQICSILNQMQTQGIYRDLKTISASSGELYLYSELHLTEKYAALLVRAAVHDACATIVQTVREESRIYPRPTKVSIFTGQAYSIPAASLQPCIVKILNNPEFTDIRKLVHPGNEAVYLYSNLHLNERQACSIMKWLEEGSAVQPEGDDLG